MQRLRLIALKLYMASTHCAYSGVPNSQTILTIYAVRKKLQGVILFVAKDTV